MTTSDFSTEHEIGCRVDYCVTSIVIAYSVYWIYPRLPKCDIMSANRMFMLEVDSVFISERVALLVAMFIENQCDYIGFSC